MSGMLQVRFMEHDRAVTVQPGTTIMEAAKQAGVQIEFPCAGNGTCGKCAVQIRPNVQRNQTPVEISLVDTHETVPACNTRIITSIDIYSANRKEEQLRILTEGRSALDVLDPFFHKETPEGNGSSRIYAGSRLLDIVPEKHEHNFLGAVVDIGTTTIVALIVDLESGQTLVSRSTMNPQAIHAQDVLSRVKIASDPQGLYTLYSAVVKTVNELLNDMCNELGVSARNIYEVIYSGNTCMMQLAVGESPATLARSPYTPSIRGDQHYPAHEHNLGIADEGLIYLPPIISGYVGSDVVSGMLATRIMEIPGVSLLMDIGTNGEMVLCHDGRIAATSTAAGPAFEGMNITCGMRAANGAIDSIWINTDGALEIGMIGDCEPAGFCGTGLIDIIAELALAGVLEKSGKFKARQDIPLVKLHQRLIDFKDRPAFFINDKVRLTQGDVRQMQLAKAAIRTGIDFLLREMNLDAAAVDRVYIAGGFGYHLRPESLIRLGLLPVELQDRIEFVGNTSVSGGRAFLLNKEYRSQMNALVKSVSVIDLANCEDFDRCFAGNMGLQSAVAIPKAFSIPVPQNSDHATLQA